MIASLKNPLIVKELHQVVRDPGNVGIAVICRPCSCSSSATA
ncbi:MAG: hypothetical protein ACLT8E_04350 [Akkermansia sp.]